MTKTKMKDGDMVYCNLKPCAFGSALGIYMGLVLFIVAICAGHFNWGEDYVKLASSIYVGYGTHFVGALIGLAYGLVCGFIFGNILARIYNFCLCCPACRCPVCKCK
jgi:hypothetical protein